MPFDLRKIPRGDATALTQALVRIDSRNPTLSPDSPGEKEVATALAEALESWGFTVDLPDTAPGRPNVVARLGPAAAPALMFCGHLDTVGVEGMTHDPFSGEIIGDKLFGRGSCDMKSGVAAMCAAAVKAYDEAGRDARRQIVIAAVTDEEYESIGIEALLASGVTADRAIITEPTQLAICTAHRGFVWTEIEFTGRAAHGSRYDLGVDAIRHAALVLAELDEMETVGLHSRSHPLLGRGSLHASTITGGVGLTTYPESCVVTIERRTIPGETAEDSLAEVRDACARVRLKRPELSAKVNLVGAQLPSDVPRSAAVVKSLERALHAEGRSAPIEGLSAWTDAALLNAAGITTVLFGPGDLGLAHAAEEFVPVGEIEQATAVLTRVAQEWMTGL